MSQLNLVNYDGTDARRITAIEGGSVDFVSWSPTGSRVGFSVTDLSGDTEFRTIRPDGTGMRTVIADATWADFVGRRPPLHPTCATDPACASTRRRTTGSMHALLPIRLFLAQAGAAGDSGALVSDSTGTGMGLYMGEVTNQAGVREGVCQHLEQVVQNLNVSLLR